MHCMSQFHIFRATFDIGVLSTIFPFYERYNSSFVNIIIFPFPMLEALYNSPQNHPINVLPANSETVSNLFFQAAKVLYVNIAGCYERAEFNPFYCLS